MIYLPTMLIFTLAASLVVAFIMNPVFAVDFMNHPEGESKQKKKQVFKSLSFWVLIGVGIIARYFWVLLCRQPANFFALLVIVKHLCA